MKPLPPRPDALPVWQSKAKSPGSWRLWDQHTTFGRIYAATGADLDGQTPREWARSVDDPALRTLQAVQALAKDYWDLLEELA